MTCKAVRSLVLSFSVLLFSLSLPADTKVKSVKRKTASTATAPVKISSMDRSDLKVDVTNVESQQTLKKLDSGRIALVQIDSGEANKFVSQMGASALYLIFYRDGGVNNEKAAFFLGDINSYKIQVSEGSTLKLNLECKDEELQPLSVDSVINFEKFERKFMALASNEDEQAQDTIVPGEITMSKKCLPTYE